MFYIFYILFQVCFLIMKINLFINKAWKNSILHFYRASFFFFFFKRLTLYKEVF